MLGCLLVKAVACQLRESESRLRSTRKENGLAVLVEYLLAGSPAGDNRLRGRSSYVDDTPALGAESQH